ncbi:MAG: hypothetical protein HYZ85_04655 [Candidatus Omnitrophica bacterium]|nr:hypothetical protein [Candidatus Omnitrophota bacterium]
MKKLLLRIMFVVLGISFTAMPSWAEPERIEIKNGQKRLKEKSAEAQIKNMDLKNIEDPEARMAIGEILNYLNLQAKK